MEEHEVMEESSSSESTVAKTRDDQGLFCVINFEAAAAEVV